MTEETAEHYADRVLAYCMKTTNTVSHSDPELNSKTKVDTQPQTNPIDKVFDNYFSKPSTVKPKTVSANPIDKLFEDY